jgi:GntR family transcriptional regulator
VIRIDPHSGEPLFAQIVLQVKGAVARGHLAAGAQLPSVRELAVALTINPNTVVRAYEALERDGVIVRKKGSGCFVTEQRPALLQRARQRQVDGLLGRAVTEAFHLGASSDEIRDACERGIDQLRFRDAKENTR